MHRQIGHFQSKSPCSRPCFSLRPCPSFHSKLHHVQRASLSRQLLRCKASLEEFVSKSAAAKVDLSTSTTTSPVTKGELLVAIPLDRILTIDTARPLFGNLVDKVGEWEVMCLLLIVQVARGASSPWAPYFASIRGSHPDMLSAMSWHPLCWSQERREQLLAGSPMLSTLERRCGDVLLSLQDLVEGGAEGVIKTLQLDPSELLTEANVKWASAVLLSRGVYINLSGDDMDDADEEQEQDGEGMLNLGMDGQNDDDDETEDEANHLVEEPVDLLLDDFQQEDEAADLIDQLGGDEVRLALVPVADSLPYAADAPDYAAIKFDTALQCAIVRAHRNYAADETVVRSVGAFKSASELLLDLGRVDAGNSNEWLEVPLRDLAYTKNKGNKRLVDACLKRMGVEVSVVLDADGPDETVLSWLRAANAVPDDLAVLGWGPENPNKAGRGGRMGGRGGRGGRGFSSSDRSAPPPTAKSKGGVYATGNVAAEELREEEEATRALAAVTALEVPMSVDTELRALESLKFQVEQRLSKYPTTLEEDEAWCRKNRDAGEEMEARRAIMAEKKALMGTGAAVQKYLAAIRGGASLRKIYSKR